MQYHEIVRETQTTNKPKSRTYKDFDPAKNLVIVDDGYGSIYAYNGSPRGGGKKIGAAFVHDGPKRSDGETVFQIFKSAVDEKYRRKGVARAMYDAVEVYCERKGGYLVPATSVSDEAFAFWNSWKPHRIAYDGRHVQKFYLGKVIHYKDLDWELYHSAGHGYGIFFGKIVGGKATTVIPRDVVIAQVGDFFPKTPAPYPPMR